MSWYEASPGDIRPEYLTASGERVGATPHRYLAAGHRRRVSVRERVSRVTRRLATLPAEASALVPLVGFVAAVVAVSAVLGTA